MRLLEDLKKINSLDDAQFGAFLKHVNGNELASFKDLSEFEAFSASIALKFNDAKTIVKVLNFVMDLAFEKRDLTSALKYFEDTFLEPAKKDTDAVRAWTRIKDNVGALSSFFLFRKKYKLRNIQPSLFEFNVICDARPIYDSSKTISDYLFPMILKVKTDSDQSLICELEEEDLSLMETEIAYAKHKLLSLKSTLKSGLQKGSSNG